MYQAEPSTATKSQSACLGRKIKALFNFIDQPSERADLVQTWLRSWYLVAGLAGTGGVDISLTTLWAPFQGRTSLT
jgi:hypothetical protein